MSWVTIAWAAVASSCLTLAGVSLLVWLRDRAAVGYSLFSLAAVSLAAVSVGEFLMMRAQTPAAFAVVQRWTHVPVFVVLISLVGFVQYYLGTGRLWLAATVCGLRLLALLVNFLSPSSLNYLEIPRLQALQLFGESVSVADGVPNPWTHLGLISQILVVVYVVDASVRLWRRGDPPSRRRAAIVGGSVAMCILFTITNAVLLHTGLVHAPYFISFSFVVILLAMGNELSWDMIRAAQLARQLRESETRLELAARAANLGMWAWDTERDEIHVTPEAHEMLGVTDAEPFSLQRFIGLLHADDRARVWDALQQSLHGDVEYLAEYRIPLADGRDRWIAARGSAERDAEGRPVLMRGVLLDVTRQKESELERQGLRDELARAGRVTALGQLTSALAHELSQPLGAILRNAEAAELLLNSPSPDLDELRAIVEDIHRDDRRAGDVIDRQRSLLKRKQIDTRSLGVAELVEDVVSLVRTEALLREVVLEVDLPRDLPAVRGDRVHLQQVLLNLVINAMDAIKDKAAGQRRIALCARPTGDGAVEISVSDAGHGIPGDMLQSIFEPFNTTKPEGMGLGLTVSRTIVQAHGGRIWAENNADGGATFRFTIPADVPGKTR